MVELGSVVGLLLMIFTCVLLRPYFFFWRKRRQLRLYGVTVQGQVIGRYQERGARGLPWYYLTCRYSYEGQTYVSNQPVWRDHYERGELFVSVRCLPDNPEVATIFGDDFQYTENLPTTILVLIFFLVGVFIFIKWFPNLFPSISPAKGAFLAKMELFLDERQKSASFQLKHPAPADQYMSRLSFRPTRRGQPV